LSSDILFVVGNSAIQVAAAVVFALLLHYFAERGDRSYLRFWSAAWLAFALYIVFSTAARLATSSPPTSPMRVSLSILSLTGGVLQAMWVGLGTYELSQRRRVERAMAGPFIAAAMVVAVALTFAWIGDPAASDLRYFARVGVRALLSSGAFLGAGAWFAWRTRRERTVGSRLFSLAMLLYGLDQLFAVYLALPVGRSLESLDPARLLFGQLDLFLQLLIGLGMLIWMLEKERDDRILLEGRLLQGQKMEALGRLAGGVAHDFNNLLMAIGGNVDFSLMQVPAGHPARIRLMEIGRATARAADLTRQLLAFSRQRHLRTQLLDLNAAVADLSVMLRRLIAEDVAVDLQLSGEALYVQGDISLVDQALMNLALNARDAMPSGGRVTIGTSAVEIDAAAAATRPERRAGAFVCLRVADTGSGISDADLHHIFEPFYTTKEVGRGTGLGLATTLGVIQQHGGWIEVATELGTGSTFTAFLPRAEVPSAPVTDPTPVSLRSGSGETILLTEDEASIRGIMAEALTGQGYVVIEAADGPSALALAASSPAVIDLLITDIVMPGGMTGFELAKALRTQQPSLAIIFMSGYHDDSVKIGEDGDAYLAKPVSLRDMLQTTRRCLDARTPAAGQ
jgi:signal transduction histidine kinase/ActR/RegA family two-component response regulator